MNLREDRANKGLQRKFVVSKIGISSKHLNDIEAGRVTLTEKFAVKLSQFYGVDINLILEMYKEGRNAECRDSEKTETTS
jgi:transcriptional regulator with XRE-family HTH domain